MPSLEIKNWEFLPVKQGSFDSALATIQREASDVLIFSELLQALVMVLWPCHSDGVSIPTEHIRGYLIAHSLYWPCFAAPQTLRRYPVGFSHGQTGRRSDCATTIHPAVISFKARRYRAPASVVLPTGDLKRLHLVHNLLSMETPNYACPDYLGDPGIQLGALILYDGLSFHEALSPFMSSPKVTAAPVIRSVLRRRVVYVEIDDDNNTILPAAPKPILVRGPTTMTRHCSPDITAVLWRMVTGEGVPQIELIKALYLCRQCRVVFLCGPAIHEHVCGTHHVHIDIPHPFKEHLGTGVVRGVSPALRSVLVRLLGKRAPKSSMDELMYRCNRCENVLLAGGIRRHECPK
ncbi:hypothetical protein C8F01DRAFT_1094907 [Mycena amicta]|nr:hypothetical protein C8F01DRAFT_1094907 [Mycena amicta]